MEILSDTADPIVDHTVPPPMIDARLQAKCYLVIDAKGFLCDHTNIGIILDTGTSHHVFNHGYRYDNFHLQDTPIYLGGSEKHSVLSYGTGRLGLCHDILVLRPEDSIGHNLVCPSLLTAQGFTITISKSGFLISHPDHPNWHSAGRLGEDRLYHFIDDHLFRYANLAAINTSN
jgi:hypothetical protein